MSGLGAAGIAAIVSAGIGATGAGLSFAQAGKARRAARDAESKAAEAMRLARKRLEINYLDELAIQKEPYELAREAALQQGATALEAAREGDQRGIAATAGRLEVAQDAAQGQIRTQMGKEMSNLDRLVAEEDARLRDLNVQLDLGEVQGFQAQAANQEAMANQAMMQGFQGAADALTSAAQVVPLYSQNIDAQQQAIGSQYLSADQTKALKDSGNVTFTVREGKFLPGIFGKKIQKNIDPTNQDLISTLDNRVFRKFDKSLSDTQRANLKGRSFLEMYNLQQGLGVADPKNPAQTERQLTIEQAKRSGEKRFMKQVEILDDDGKGTGEFKEVMMTNAEIAKILGI
tara:strand:+ start:15296 stop:16333 length:1038 start_codon:yes stop_codon:yes gene_type:complete